MKLPLLVKITESENCGTTDNCAVLGLINKLHIWCLMYFLMSHEMLFNNIFIFYMYILIFYMYTIISEFFNITYTYMIMGVIPFCLHELSTEPAGTVLSDCRPRIMAFDRAIMVNCTIVIDCQLSGNCCWSPWSTAIFACMVTDRLVDSTGREKVITHVMMTDTYHNMQELSKIQLIQPQHDKNNKINSAPSEDSDQPGHPPSLIRAFAVRIKCLGP